MAYNRGVLNYWEKAVYVTSGAYDTDQTVSGSVVQLSRVHDASWSVNYALVEDMYLNGGSEAYLTVPTQPTFNLAWYHTNGANERWLGLVDLLPPSGNLGFNIDQEKNLYISVENTDVDAIGASGVLQTKTVIGLGQALMSSYEIGAQVGGLVQSRATFNCLSSYVYTGASGDQIPAVHSQDGTQLTGLFVLPTAASQYGALPSGYYSTGSVNDVSAIAATDMIMMFPVGTPFGVVFTGSQSCYIQGFNCSLGIERHELKPLGYAFPPHRGIIYPIHVDLTTEAIVSSYQADQLQRIGCLATGQSVYLVVKQPCSNATLFGLYFSDLQLESQESVTSIGRSDAVSIRWRGIITSPYQPFFNPSVGFIVQQGTSIPWGTNW